MINNSLLKGKGLFVYSDPGGARGVLSLVYELKDSLSDYLIISDREYAFVNDYNLKICSYSEGMENLIFESFKPNFLYTGTSYTSLIELNFINKAIEAKEKINVFTFIDHWTNLKKRFIYHQKLLLPDFIHVIDEKARILSIEDGLPVQLLIVVGHPYHRFLKKWKPDILLSDFLIQNDIPENKKIILYAPDPLTNVGGVDKYGFDEVTGLQFLINAFENYDKVTDFIILLKPHPNQNLHVFNSFLAARKLIIGEIEVQLLSVSISNNLLIYYSEVIVSFFSNILSEAILIGKKTISLHLGEMFCNLPPHELHKEIQSTQELINIIDAC